MRRLQSPVGGNVRATACYRQHSQPRARDAGHKERMHDLRAYCEELAQRARAAARRLATAGGGQKDRWLEQTARAVESRAGESATFIHNGGGWKTYGPSPRPSPIRWEREK